MALTRQCCACHRIYEPSASPEDGGPGRWVFASAPLGDVTHTYCPRCYERALGELRRLARLQNAPGAGS